jgi:hypothetical protein
MPCISWGKIIIGMFKKQYVTNSNNLQQWIICESAKSIISKLIVLNLPSHSDFGNKTLATP